MLPKQGGSSMVTAKDAARQDLQTRSGATDLQRGVGSLDAPWEGL